MSVLELLGWLGDFWFLIILVALAMLTLAFVVRRLTSRKLGGSVKTMIENDLAAAVRESQPQMRVMRTDAVLDKALGACGYRGSLADKLKKAGPRLKNLDDVWSAHKLRNRIAHEPSHAVSEAQAGKAVSVLENAVRSLLR